MLSRKLILTEIIYKQNYDGKIVTITDQNSVLCMHLRPGMADSDHEEACAYIL